MPPKRKTKRSATKVQTSVTSLIGQRVLVAIAAGCLALQLGIVAAGMAISGGQYYIAANTPFLSPHSLPAVTAGQPFGIQLSVNNFTTSDATQWTLTHDVTTNPSGGTLNLTADYVCTTGIPPACAANSATLSGTVTIPGTYRLDVTVTEGGDSVSRTYMLRVIGSSGAPSIGPEVLNAVTAGQPFSIVFTAEDFPSIAQMTWSFWSTVNHNLQFQVNSSPSGCSNSDPACEAPSVTLSGTIAAPGTYSFMVGATNIPSGAVGMRHYVLTINPAAPPTITPGTLPIVTAGEDFAFIFKGENFINMQGKVWTVNIGNIDFDEFTFSGISIPSGCANTDPTCMVPEAIMTGRIATPGVYTFSVGVGGCGIEPFDADNCQEAAMRDYTLVVQSAEAPRITPTTIGPFVAGEPIYLELTAENFISLQGKIWGIDATNNPDGSLSNFFFGNISEPANCASNNPNCMVPRAYLQGTINQPGTYEVTISVGRCGIQPFDRPECLESAEQTYTITVTSPVAPDILPDVIDSIEPGVPFSIPLTAANFATTSGLAMSMTIVDPITDGYVTLTQSGLPAGCTLGVQGCHVSGGTLEGVINQPGDYLVQLSASVVTVYGFPTQVQLAFQEYTLHVGVPNDGLSADITPDTLSTVKAGVPFDLLFSALNFVTTSGMQWSFNQIDPIANGSMTLDRNEVPDGCIAGAPGCHASTATLSGLINHVGTYRFQLSASVDIDTGFGTTPAVTQAAFQEYALEVVPADDGDEENPDGGGGGGGGGRGIVVPPAPGPGGLPLLNEAQLVITPGNAAVYIILAGKRHVFPNGKIYRSWYGDDFSNVRTISREELNNYGRGRNVVYNTGSLIKITSDPKVYYVGNDGLLRWVESESYFVSSGFSFNQIEDLPEVFFPDYTIGAPYSPQ